MAPLPPEGTGRYFIDYISSQEHTMMVRANAALGPAAFGTAMDAIFTAIEPIMNAFTIVQVRWAPSGSNISNAVVSGIETNTYGDGGIPSGNDRSKCINFQGRASSGRRVSFSVYTVADIQPDYRLTGAEAAYIATAVGVLNDTANLGLAIDGVKALWKSYVNTTDNSYWQRQLRV